MLEWGRQAGLDLRYGDVPCAGGLGVVGVVGGVLTLIMANDATVKGKKSIKQGGADFIK